MILLVDIGNTRLKWACLEGDAFARSGEVNHVGLGLAEVAEKAWPELPKPERLVVSNVAGREAAQALTVWSRHAWDINPEFIVSEQTALGVTNAYHNGEQLGTDRWAALLACRAKAFGDVCIVDCGTAITIDVLAADGQHLGGLIVPGLAMMRRTLTDDTCGIRSTGAESDAGDIALLARNTGQAVAAGTLYAAVAVVDRVTSDIAAELQVELALILTGGDAPQILPLVRGPFRHEPELVLKGLAVIARSGS